MLLKAVRSLAGEAAAVRLWPCLPQPGASGAAFHVAAPASMAARINVQRDKEGLVTRLLDAKEATGKTYTQISEEVGLTNAYTAQLFFNQAQLKPDRVAKLKAAVPGIKDADIETMKKVPFRSFDPSILTEPTIYRMQEAVMHYAEAVQAICAEECGDGIMSAIDMFASIDTVKGKTGEKRVCITLNGKFLPHIEQAAENNTVPPPPKFE